jgi:hypothetical protein
MVLKTRLHHIENGHKPTAVLGFVLPPVLRRSAQKQGAFCAPFCVIRP